MTGAMEAVESVVALAFGGFLFIVIGGALSSSMLNLRLWGVIYLLAAIGLGALTVYGLVRSIAN